MGLHALGEWLRGWLVAVPMPLVRALFVSLPLLLLVWLWTLPLERPGGAAGLESGDQPVPRRQLRWAATVALAFQVAIYTWEWWSG